MSADPEDQDPSQDQVVRILAVQPAGERLYLLFTIYQQSDAMNAVGQVHVDSIGREGDAEMVLSVSDPLSTLWTSPAGHVWTASAAGNVWTTAPVRFPDPLAEEVPADSPDPAHPFSATSLPKLWNERYLPNITCLYGFSDDDVFAGTYEGSVYHWDGSRWAELPTPQRSGIIEMHGSSREHLYAVGDDRLVLHYDGSQWRDVPVSGEVDEWAVLSGIRVAAPDDVYACDIHGHVYRGGPSALRVIAETDTQWRGVAIFHGRVYLTSSPGGAWVLEGETLRSVRPDFSALDITEAGAALFFIEEEQKPDPSFWEYNPTEIPHWGRRRY